MGIGVSKFFSKWVVFSSNSVPLKHLKIVQDLVSKPAFLAHIKHKSGSDSVA